MKPWSHCLPCKQWFHTTAGQWLQRLKGFRTLWSKCFYVEQTSGRLDFPLAFREETAFLKEPFLLVYTGRGLPWLPSDRTGVRTASRPQGCCAVRPLLGLIKSLALFPESLFCLGLQAVIQKHVPGVGEDSFSVRCSMKLSLSNPD